MSFTITNSFFALFFTFFPFFVLAFSVCLFLCVCLKNLLTLFFCFTKHLVLFIFYVCFFVPFLEKSLKKSLLLCSNTIFICFIFLHLRRRVVVFRSFFCFYFLCVFIFVCFYFLFLFLPGASSPCFPIMNTKRRNFCTLVLMKSKKKKKKKIKKKVSLERTE